MTAIDETTEPERIGPYRILERIGEGGMGLVYLAEQSEPVRRRVALKLIKLGMDTKEVIGRFDTERQALALMSHPNIARILDAGATETGRPFFVMEYVPGVPMTDYCDRKRLQNRDRLALFVQVCHAVQHAHQKGIIHRDLKPTNILVAEDDGRPLPKVIDFGVAKAINQRLTEHTVYTELGRFIGTPVYMSPEQAGTTALDVDTRSDVYSLGAVLYELLIGSLPFDPKTLAQSGLDEMRRLVREVDPSPPSTRLSKLGDIATTAARNRGATPQALRRGLRGELDWITMKALEKDRNRRYSTAAALADDLSRYLAGEPVSAGRPSRLHRMRRTLGRHKVAFGFAATVVVSLAALAMSTAIHSREVRREAERTALAARRAEEQAERADREARSAQRVADFLVSLFEISDPEEARGNSITAREILDRGYERIRVELRDDPLVQARMLLTIGLVYDKLGLHAASTPLFEDAVSIAREHASEDAASVAECLASLAQNQRKLGQYAGAEASFAELIELGEAHRDEDPLRLASALDGMGSLLVDWGRAERAIAYHERALALREAASEPGEAALDMTLNNLGAAYFKVDRVQDAADAFARALEAREAAGTLDSPDAAYLLCNLGTLYVSLGKLAEAQDATERSLALVEEHLDPGHELVAAVHSQLARINDSRGADPALIESLYRRAHEARRTLLGPDHVVVGQDAAAFGAFLARRGRHDEARVLLADALRTHETFFGASHESAVELALALAELDLDQGRADDATGARIERCLEIVEASAGPESPRLADVLATYARYLEAIGLTDQAQQAVARAAALRGTGQ